MNSQNIPSQSPGLFQFIMFALGQFGWALANACITLLVVYFYHHPTHEGTASLPPFIEKKIIFLGFTVVGIAMFVGTIISAIMDILMGSWSDKATFRFGRRRSFLAIAFIPVAISTWMCFFPPVNGISHLNTLWLCAALLLYNIFQPMYVTPFNGLISELGHHQKDRILISTLLSVTWGLGFISANGVFYFKEILQKSMSPIEAFQLIIGIFCLIAVLFMTLPIIFINEEKHCIRHESVSGNPFTQMKEVLQNLNFRKYAWVEMLYWFSSQFLQLGVPYYVTALLGLSEKNTTFVIILAAIFAFLSYAPVAWMSQRYGKKKVMLFGYALIILDFIFIATLGYIPLPLWLLALIMIALNALPMSIFGILPMALVADMATEEGQKSGQFRAATYFGVKSFAMKIGISFTNLLFPTLILLGNSAGQSTGIRLTAIAGLLATISSAGLMLSVKNPETT